MSVVWKEGMHKQAKERLVSMLSSWERVEFKEEHYKYVRYSQFYKICVNRFGSKSPQINEGFTNEQKFRNKLAEELNHISQNISGFMFGFTKCTNNEPKIGLIYLYDSSQSLEDFKKAVDKDIQRIIINNLTHLQKKVYSRNKIGELRQKIEALQSKPVVDEQSFFEMREKWQALMTDAVNINCMYQVLAEIQTTYNNIIAFKSSLAQKAISIHSGKVLEKLYEYGLTHRDTDYNSAETK